MILRELEAGDEDALRAAVREMAADDPDWEFAFRFDASTDFAAYLEMLEDEKRGVDGWVPQTYLVAVEGERIVGRFSLRHRLNDPLRRYGGHIGFGVVPSARRRGIGTEMLRQGLPLARAVGIERALLTCSDDNAASIRIIETCGGVLEDRVARSGGGLTRRYWIDL